MNGPKYVIVGSSTLLVKDGAYRPAGGDVMIEFSGEDVDFMILANAARPVQVGDVVTIDGLKLTVTEVVE